MIKKIVSIILCMSLLSSVAFAGSYSSLSEDMLNRSITAANKYVNNPRSLVPLNYNGKNIGSALIVNGRTLVPVRQTMEALGYKISWDERLKSAWAIKPGSCIVFPINQTCFGYGSSQLNAMSQYTNFPNVSVGGVMYTPLRDIAPWLKIYAKWETDTPKIDLTSNVISTPTNMNTYDPPGNLCPTRGKMLYNNNISVKALDSTVWNAVSIEQDWYTNVWHVVVGNPNENNEYLYDVINSEDVSVGVVKETWKDKSSGKILHVERSMWGYDNFIMCSFMKCTFTEKQEWSGTYLNGYPPFNNKLPDKLYYIQ